MIGLRVRTQPLNHLLTYTINVHRLNSKATLTGIDVFERAVISGAVVEVRYPLDPKFNPIDPDVIVATEVPYERCRVLLRGFTNDRYTEFSVNDGVNMSHGESISLALPESGEYNFDIVTKASVGDATEAYSLAVTRAEGTAEQIAANATLKSLALTDVDLSSTFTCFSSVMSGNVNRDVTSVQLIVSPSESGVSLRFGVPLLEDNVVIGLADGAVEILAETPVDIALAESNESRAVEVTSADGTVIKYYRIELTHLNTNVVPVNSAAALQSALKNAEPGDEIVVAAGEYLGEASLETSGDVEAHYFSDRSGITGDPIILRSDSVTDLATLLGQNLTDKTVLKLSGDFWQVKYIGVEGARNGILLDAANNAIVDNVTVRNVGERGMILANGSSGNQVYGSRFTSTGLSPREGLENWGEAIVVGSPADDWAAAPEGTLDEKDYDNAIRSNQFGPSLGAEAIQINEGALRTQVQYNIFEARDIGVVEDGSMLVVKGNDSEITYNHFYNTVGTGLSALVTTKNISADWVSDNWGEGNAFYQNIADLGGADMVLADSTDVSLLNVAENTRSDSIDVRYSGAGINENFRVPVYQIQTAVENALCLREQRPYPTREDLLANENALSVFPVIYMANCEATVAQQWKLVNAGSGYVFVSPADATGRILLPHTPGFTSSSSFPVAITLDPSEDLPRILNFWEGYYLRWALLHNGDEVIFSNRSAPSYVLTGSDGVDDPAAVFQVGFGIFQFRLVEQ